MYDKHHTVSERDHLQIRIPIRHTPCQVDIQTECERRARWARAVLYIGEFTSDAKKYTECESSQIAVTDGNDKVCIVLWIDIHKHE